MEFPALFPIEFSFKKRRIQKELAKEMEKEMQREHNKKRLQVVLIRDKARMPMKTHSGDAGFDLFCPETVTIQGRDWEKIPLGIALSLPTGYYGRIADRSSLAYHEGIHVLGGVVDNGYRGEVSVILYNLNESPIEIKQGCRCAQIILTPYLLANEFDIVDCLTETARGIGGFGSTGK